MAQLRLAGSQAAHNIMRPGYINSIPQEILSEILLTVIESFAGDVYLKWESPLRFTRVSKWFYQVTTNTPSLWRYLYIRPSLHRYLKSYISRSGSQTLVADVMYVNAYWGDKRKAWKEMVNSMIPAFPRLKTLLFHSPWDNDPVIQLLQYKMPALNSLDVQGSGSEQSLDNDILLSHLPELRYLRSFDFFDFENGLKIPYTLEELHRGSVTSDELEPSERFWAGLSSALRTLRIDKFTLEALNPPLARQVYLPRLIELKFREYCSEGQLSVLRYLNAPLLRTLDVMIKCDAEAEPDTASLSLDFPALTHLQWRALPPVLQLDNLLRHCTALTSVRITTNSRSASVSAFVEALESNPCLLPQLEELFVLGASILSLRRLVRARPLLRCIEVHRSDVVEKYLLNREERVERRECAAWLASHVDLRIDDSWHFTDQ